MEDYADFVLIYNGLLHNPLYDGPPVFLTLCVEICQKTELIALIKDDFDLRLAFESKEFIQACESDALNPAP